MEKNWKTRNREIREGKNLEQNIPMFLNESAGLYCNLASVELALVYPAFYEALQDGDLHLCEQDSEFVGAINVLVEEAISGAFDGEKEEHTLLLISALRSELICKMDVLTAYADRFLLREYMLNRMEYRFKEIPDYAGDDETAREILREIFSDADNSEINEKIRIMLAQLPIRMTKNKFFTYLEDSLENYIGQDTDTVESYLYMIRSAAGITSPQGMDVEGAQVNKLLKELDDILNSDCSEEQYETAKVLFAEATDYLNNASDLLMNMQQIVNYVYTILLLRPYSTGENETETRILTKTKEAFKCLFAGEETPEFMKELEEDLTLLEGKIESLLSELPSWESSLEAVKTSYKNMFAPLMVENVYERIRLVQRLLDNSIFADLEESDEPSKVTKDYIDTVKKTIVEEIGAGLSAGNKYLNRAVIAAVLKEVPIFFSSRTEVMDYVRNSLSGCHDLTEKTTSVELFMQEMGNWH